GTHRYRPWRECLRFLWDNRSTQLRLRSRWLGRDRPVGAPRFWAGAWSRAEEWRGPLSERCDPVWRADPPIFRGSKLRKTEHRRRRPDRLVSSGLRLSTKVRRRGDW